MSRSALDPPLSRGTTVFVALQHFLSLREKRSNPSRNLRPEFPESLVEAIKRLLENRTWGGKVETQPGFTAGPELLAGAGENARPVLDPCGDILGRQPGAGE